MTKPLKKIFIYANERQEKEIRLKPTSPGVDMYFSNSFPSQKEIALFEGFFLLKKEYIQANENEGFWRDGHVVDFTGKPVIIHATLTTLSEARLPANFSRINAWPGFLARDTWEIASREADSISPFFQSLAWKIRLVKDVPGLVAARVLGMIINEAFYALKENISTREEIDLAMKLGTNYPKGPFEWAGEIGIKAIFDLLTILAEQDERYQPAFTREGSCI